MSSISYIILCSQYFLALLITFMFSSQIIAKKSVIIDFDMGLGEKHKLDQSLPSDIDDVFALLQVLHTNSLELQGVSTVFGNTHLKNVNKSFSKFLKVSKLHNIPWQSGAHAKMSRNSVCSSCAMDASKFISNILEKPSYIVAIGPLTNIACLIKHYPQNLQNILGILVVMGQSTDTNFSINNVALPDYNFESDVEATQIILGSSIPMIFFPFELSKDVLIAYNKLKENSNKSKVAQYVFNHSKEFLRFWAQTFHEEGFHPWDSAPIGFLTNPKLFTCEYRNMKITQKDSKSFLYALKNKTKNDHLFCHQFSSQSAKAVYEYNILNALTSIK